MRFAYRGYPVFCYDPKTKEVTALFNFERQPNFNNCCWNAADLEKLSEFFATVAKHMRNESVELQDVHLI